METIDLDKWKGYIEGAAAKIREVVEDFKKKAVEQGRTESLLVQNVCQEGPPGFELYIQFGDWCSAKIPVPYEDAEARERLGMMSRECRVVLMDALKKALAQEGISVST